MNRHADNLLTSQTKGMYMVGNLRYSSVVHCNLKTSATFIFQHFWILWTNFNNFWSLQSEITSAYMWNKIHYFTLIALLLLPYEVLVGAILW